MTGAPPHPRSLPPPGGEVFTSQPTPSLSEQLTGKHQKAMMKPPFVERFVTQVLFVQKSGPQIARSLR